MEWIAPLIGTLAAIASTTSFAPQAWHIIRTRQVDGLSSGMYVLTVMAFALWLTYGIVKGDWALIVPNLICLAMSLFILGMILMSAQTRHAVADSVETAVGSD